MKNIEIVPATQELLRDFYGKSHARTARALVVLEDTKPIAVVGVAIEDSCNVVFSDVIPEVRAHIRDYRRGVVQCARRVMRLARRGLPIYATADPEVEGSGRLLTHMGFEQIKGDIYRCRA